MEQILGLMKVEFTPQDLQIQLSGSYTVKISSINNRLIFITLRYVVVVYSLL